MKLNIYIIVALLSYFGASNSGWLCCFEHTNKVASDFERAFSGDDSTGITSNEYSQVAEKGGRQQDLEAEVVETDSGNLNRPKEGDSVAILKLPQERYMPPILKAIHNSNRGQAGLDVGQRIWISDLEEKQKEESTE